MKIKKQGPRPLRVVLIIWIVLLLLCAAGASFLSAQRAVTERRRVLPTVGGYKLCTVSGEASGYPKGSLLVVKPGGPYVRGNTLLLLREEEASLEGRYLPVRLTGLKYDGVQGETLTGEALTFAPMEIIGRIETCLPGMGRVYAFLSNWTVALPVILGLAAVSLLPALLVRTPGRKKKALLPADSMDLFAAGEPSAPLDRGKPALAFPQPLAEAPSAPALPAGAPYPTPAQPVEVPSPAPTQPAEVPYPTPTQPVEAPGPAPTQPVEAPYPAPTQPAEAPGPAPAQPAEAPGPAPAQPAEAPGPSWPISNPAQEAAVAIYREEKYSFAPDYLHTGDSLEAFKAFLAEKASPPEAEEILIRLDGPSPEPPKEEKKRDHPASHRWRGVYRKRESFYERYARAEEDISLSADEIIRLHQKDYAEQRFRPAFIAVVEEELHKEEPGGTFHNRNGRE